MNSVFKKILFEKRPFAKLAFFSVADGLLIMLSVILAFLVRFEGYIPARYLLNVEGIIILSLLITLLIFYFLKLYYFTWSYVSAEELIALVKGVFLSFLVLTATFFVLRDQPIFSGFPRSTLFITYFFVFVLCGGLRFGKRAFLQLFPSKKQGEKKRTLIVGAGDAGEQLLRSIAVFSSSPYLPVGFVDDRPAKLGASIHGLKVFGAIKDIPKIVRENKIEGLIIAIPSAGSQIIQEAVEKGREAGLRKIKIVPPIEELISGRVSIGQLREVEISDLLDREVVVSEQKSIENFIKDKTILVTGAAGSIGSELCRQIARFKPLSLIILDQDETGIFNIAEELEDSFFKLNKSFLIADVRDKEKIERIFKEFHPNIVFHAAAYKHVPLMEENPDEAVKNNVFGTKIVAETSLKNGVESLIFVSTDKAVNPTSVMGATKRIGEMICQIFSQRNSTRFISVRFGNVLDSRGSVIPIFREKIKKREPIEVTHPDMTRFFMTTPEACLLVMQAGAMGQGGEVFVLDMGDSVKIVDLAKKMIQLSGLKPDVDIPIVFTKPRPGEKLFEEILTAEEGTIATHNQKIFMAKLSAIDKERIDIKLSELRKAAESGDKQTTIKLLKEIIPTYAR
ncbi:MAG: polysaccharide biosynthesis protein [Candidatus Pacebacteria bacterium]|nr:polysaccharide biosynthesis protein [Candidatus Paceibacterota bacterium]